MRKLLTATGVALLLANVGMAPAFADSLEEKTQPLASQQMLLPEGEMMSDAELSEVEGEGVPIWAIVTVAGAGIGGYTSYQNCAAAGRKDCWVDAGWGAVSGGAMIWGLRSGIRGGGGGFGRGAYGR